MTLNTSCQSSLACKVSFEKSADSLMGTPLQVTICLSLAAIKVLSLSLTSGILMMMCLGVVARGNGVTWWRGAKGEVIQVPVLVLETHS